MARSFPIGICIPRRLVPPRSIIRDGEKLFDRGGSDGSARESDGGIVVDGFCAGGTAAATGSWGSVLIGRLDERN